MRHVTHLISFLIQYRACEPACACVSPLLHNTPRYWPSSSLLKVLSYLPSSVLLIEHCTSPVSQYNNTRYFSLPLLIHPLLSFLFASSYYLPYNSIFISHIIEEYSLCHTTKKCFSLQDQGWYYWWLLKVFTIHLQNCRQRSTYAHSRWRGMWGSRSAKEEREEDRRVVRGV